jgi:replicative DNA helicase
MTVADSRPNRGDRWGHRGDQAAGAELAKLFDQLPPHSIEAEMSLLGSLILAGTENVHLIGDVMQIVRQSDDFYLPKHAAIYQAIIEQYDQNQSIDSIQLTQALRDKNLFESVGGVDYLVELAESVPTAVNAPHDAAIVRDKAKLRRRR